MGTMRQNLGFAPLLFFVAVSVGCGGGEAEKKRIAEIESRAEERVRKAEREGRAKAQEAEREVEKLKAEIADMKGKLADAVSQAQASVDEQTKAAEEAIARARAAYKEEGRTKLAQLNKEVNEISAKSGTLGKAQRATFLKSMKAIQKHQKTIAADIAAFDKATLETFRETKAKLDRDLAAMRATIRTARAMLPS